MPTESDGCKFSTQGNCVTKGRLKLHGSVTEDELEVQVIERDGNIIGRLVTKTGETIINGNLFCLTKNGIYMFYNINERSPIKLQKNGRVELINPY